LATRTIPIEAVGIVATWRTIRLDDQPKVKAWDRENTANADPIKVLSNGFRLNAISLTRFTSL